MLVFHGLLELLMNSQSRECKFANAKHALFFEDDTSSPFTLCCLPPRWEAGGCDGLGKEGNAFGSGNSSSSLPLPSGLHSRVCLNSKAVGVSASGRGCYALMSSLGSSCGGLRKEFVSELRKQDCS